MFHSELCSLWVDAPLLTLILVYGNFPPGGVSHCSSSRFAPIQGAAYTQRFPPSPAPQNDQFKIQKGLGMVIPIS
jgi:hypothetical protein